MSGWIVAIMDPKGSESRFWYASEADMPEWFNRETGNPATADEVAALKERAMKILTSPYSAPEQVDWAVEAFPELAADLATVPYRPQDFPRPYPGEESDEG